MAPAPSRPAKPAPLRVPRRRPPSIGVLGGVKGWRLVGGFVWSPRIVRRHALNRGVFGGSMGWKVVAGFIWGPRLMRRTFGRRPHRVASVRMDPGTGMQLRTFRRR